MEGKEKFFTDAEKKVYDLIIGHKLQFLRECAKTAQWHRLHTFHSSTGWQQSVYLMYRDKNPNYGDKLLCIGRAIAKLNGAGWIIGHHGFDEEVEVIKKMKWCFWHKIKRFSERYGHKYHELVTNTQDIQELLARGFIYVEDYKGEPAEYWLENPYGLIWPKGFSTKASAIKIAKRFGISATIKQ